MTTLSHVLLLAAALFCLGLYGLLTRQGAIGVLVSIELMANAANLNLVAFSRLHGSSFGQVFALFAMAITVAEVAVGLAIVMLLFRGRGSTQVDAGRELRG